MFNGCWSCGAPITSPLLSCEGCGVLLPPADVSAFERLGLEVGYDLSHQELERQYFALHRRVHPDRFMGKTPTEQNHAARHAALINDAYGRLRDPLRRAETLIGVLGLDLDERSDNGLKTGDFLETILELQETLTGASSPSDVQSLYDHVMHLIRDGFLELVSLFRHHQGPEAVNVYQRLIYLHRFRDDCAMKLASV